MVTLRRECPLATLILTLAASVAAAVPAKRDDQILIQGIVAGSQTVTARGTDSVRAEYSYTDALSGYSLLHELELYVRAGIPAAQVLRMATLTSAQVSGADKERGTITAGKLADMILIDGDPTTHIEDVHKIAVVIKGGHVYDRPRSRRRWGSPRADSRMQWMHSTSRMQP